jgi:hypothetical protein
VVRAHNLGGYEETRSQKEHRHGRSQTGSRRTWAEKYPAPIKVPASSVRFGSDVSRNGKYVWVIYLDGELLCMGATAKEAKRNFYDARARRDAAELQKLNAQPR